MRPPFLQAIVEMFLGDRSHLNPENSVSSAWKSSLGLLPWEHKISEIMLPVYTSVLSSNCYSKSGDFLQDTSDPGLWNWTTMMEFLLSAFSKLFSNLSVFNSLSFRIEAGIPPVKLLFPNIKVEMFDKFPMSVGISMDKTLSPKSNFSNSFKCEIEEGMAFENSSLPSDNCCSFVRFPISSGRTPLRKLWAKFNILEFWREPTLGLRPTMEWIITEIEIPEIW